MDYPKDFYQYLKDHTLIGIRVGRDRLKYTDIWAVEVEGRIFGRSWGKSQSGWYPFLLELGEGWLKYGQRVLLIKGKKIGGPPDLMQKINQAYLDKYTQPENVSYAKAIAQPEYEDYTLEFLFVDVWKED